MINPIVGMPELRAPVSAVQFRPLSASGGGGEGRGRETEPVPDDVRGDLGLAAKDGGALQAQCEE